MTRIYYKQAAGAVIVYAVDQLDSIESVEKWKLDLIHQTDSYGFDAANMPVLLIGNKVQ